MSTIQVQSHPIPGHDGELFYCDACKYTFSATEVDWHYRGDGSIYADCPGIGEDTCCAIERAETDDGETFEVHGPTRMEFAAHLEGCKVEDQLFDMHEIQSVEECGRILRAKITNAVYDTADDDEESLISRLKEATGIQYQWCDDYEPQSDGTTTVTLECV